MLDELRLVVLEQKLSEKCYRVYEMLRLRMEVYPEVPLEVSGVPGAGQALCAREPLSRPPPSRSWPPPGGSWSLSTVVARSPVPPRTSSASAPAPHPAPAIGSSTLRSRRPPAPARTLPHPKTSPTPERGERRRHPPRRGAPRGPPLKPAPACATCQSGGARSCRSRSPKRSSDSPRLPPPDEPGSTSVSRG